MSSKPITRDYPEGAICPVQSNREEPGCWTFPHRTGRGWGMVGRCWRRARAVGCANPRCNRRLAPYAPWELTRGCASQSASLLTKLLSRDISCHPRQLTKRGRGAMDARWWLASFVMLTACLLTGCVERRFVITTTAPGLPPDKDLSSTIIDEKGMVLSASPADK